MPHAGDAVLISGIRTLTASVDGLGMIKDVFDASKTLELAVGRVELQRDVSSSPCKR
jgi:hypothetical protein